MHSQASINLTTYIVPRGVDKSVRDRSVSRNASIDYHGLCISMRHLRWRIGISTLILMPMELLSHWRYLYHHNIQWLWLPCHRGRRRVPRRLHAHASRISLSLHSTQHYVMLCPRLCSIYSVIPHTAYCTDIPAPSAAFGLA